MICHRHLRVGKSNRMRIISFGCSLSQQGSRILENRPYKHREQVGLINTLSEDLDIPYVNYSVGAASMRVINNRFSTYMLEDYNPKDIILYQITSFKRSSYDFKIYPDRYGEEKTLLGEVKYSKYYENKNNEWLISHSDGISDRVGTYVPVTGLCHNQEFKDILEYPKKFWVDRAEYNHEINMTNTLANIKMIRNMGNHVLVFFGWYDALVSSEYDYNDVFREILNENNIDYIEHPYLDWCIEQKLPQTDSYHPCMENAAPHYAKQILFPKLTEIIKR